MKALPNLDKKPTKIVHQEKFTQIGKMILGVKMNRVFMAFHYVTVVVDELHLLLRVMDRLEDGIIHAVLDRDHVSFLKNLNGIRIHACLLLNHPDNHLSQMPITLKYK